MAGGVLGIKTPSLFCQTPPPCSGAHSENREIYDRYNDKIENRIYKYIDFERGDMRMNGDGVNKVIVDRYMREGRRRDN